MKNLRYHYSRPDLVDRFEAWWNHTNEGLPLMRVVARNDAAIEPLPAPESESDRYIKFERLLRRTLDYNRSHEFLGDSFASIGADLGPGSLALYLGGEPRFERDTVWYKPCIDDPETCPALRFNPENKWWQLHLKLIRDLVNASNGDFRVDIPDLIENIDIYSAMRDPQEALYDIMDYPEKVEEFIEQIDESYFNYYDALYDIVKDDDGVSSYTTFKILGRGRVAKIQCDFSAMLSPAQYRRFVLPSLKKQSEHLDHTLYHLDGPDAIRHVPAVMEIERLNALQWTCGAGQPDGANQRWYSIYDQVTAAGKSLWVQLYDGGVDDWINGAEALMERYGRGIFYFFFPDMSMNDAEKLLKRAETRW